MADLVTSRSGALGHILLNRPTAMNALNDEMVAGVTATLDAWRLDAEIATVVVSGAGDRGLCAGGDVVGMYRSALLDGVGAAEFWRAEYAMNLVIAEYPKPYVALMDGVVLGGGVGISAHGSVRVVTERTRLGMPEVVIGYTPDVGVDFLLARAPGELGTHAALTGNTMSGSDAIALGLADHFVPSERLPDLVAALESELPDAALPRFAQQPPPSALAVDREWIDAAYAGDDPIAIVEHLTASPVAAAREAAATILSRSPTSVAVTLAALRRARGLTLEEVLDQDLRLGLRFLAGHDLVEGIRAQVIDKDRNPRWSPASLAEVSRADVESYFE
ncbi:MAG: enoyl-CoA hydratase/isomerase family protein [Rhodoglobus sp.]